MKDTTDIRLVIINIINQQTMCFHGFLQLQMKTSNIQINSNHDVLRHHRFNGSITYIFFLNIFRKADTHQIIT